MKGFRWGLFYSLLITLGVYILWVLPWSSYAWIVDPQTWLVEAGQYSVVGYYNGSYKGHYYQIGVLLEKDGIWEKYNRNPILSQGDLGTWNSRHVKDPYAVRTSKLYYLYYAGTAGEERGYSIGLALSNDGIRYDEVGEVVGNGSFPVVWVEEEPGPYQWNMLFARNGSLWYTHSDDSRNWTEERLVLTDSRGTVIPGDLVWVAEQGVFRFYYGLRICNGKCYDRMVYTDFSNIRELEKLEEGVVVLDHDNLSVTPRGISRRGTSDWIGYITVFGASEGIREYIRIASSEDGKIWNWTDEIGFLGLPNPGADRWDAISAENFVPVKEFEVE